MVNALVNPTYVNAATAVHFGKWHVMQIENEALHSSQYRWQECVYFFENRGYLFNGYDATQLSGSDVVV